MEKVSLVLALIVLLVFFWKMYIPKSSVVGIYVNNNTDYVLEGPQPITEGPPDTLTLYPDNTFTSKTWGNGTYIIEGGSMLSSSINLSYDYIMGKAGYGMGISKSYTGKIRLALSYDQNFYFEKIK